jgi:hypothetical protein
MIPDLKPEMQDLIKRISVRATYYGNKMPDSVMRQFVVEETELNCGVLVPYWISVFQRGRGARKSTTESGLVKRIYNWMEKHNLFSAKAKTIQQKMNQAKSVTWYINKYGNAHFRSKVFVDIYETERKVTISNIQKVFSSEIDKITMDVL